MHTHPCARVHTGTCICVLTYTCKHAKSLQSCPTLCDTVGLPGCLVPGILQAGVLEWVAVPFSRGSSRTRISYLLHWQAGSLSLTPPGNVAYGFNLDNQPPLQPRRSLLARVQSFLSPPPSVHCSAPSPRQWLRPLTSALGVWPAPAALLRGTPLAFKQDSTGGLCSVGMGRRDRNRGREP